MYTDIMIRKVVLFCPQLTFLVSVANIVLIFLFWPQQQFLPVHQPEECNHCHWTQLQPIENLFVFLEVLPKRSLMRPRYIFSDGFGWHWKLEFWVFQFRILWRLIEYSEVEWRQLLNRISGFFFIENTNPNFLVGIFSHCVFPPSTCKCTMK